MLFEYWAITIFGVPFQALLLNTHFVTLLIIDIVALQPRPVLLPDGLGFFAFARRYLRNTYLFIFLRLLRCFTSSGSLLFRDHMTLLTWSFLIRKFPDQRLLGTSPKLIAAILRPSSLARTKASTVRPYIPIRKCKNHLLYRAFDRSKMYRYIS